MARRLFPCDYTFTTITVGSKYDCQLSRRSDPQFDVLPFVRRSRSSYSQDLRYFRGVSVPSDRFLLRMKSPDWKNNPLDRLFPSLGYKPDRKFMLCTLSAPQPVSFRPREHSQQRLIILKILRILKGACRKKVFTNVFGNRSFSKYASVQIFMNFTRHSQD